MALAVATSSSAVAQPGQAPWATAPTTAVASQQFSFVSHGTRLVGTLYRPQIKGKVPAVVILHDASTPLGSARLYDHLRSMLPALGIAVFTFDRRGAGASGGTDSGNSLERLAEDGIAAAEFVRNQEGIDGNRVGFWGLSQGGWLSLLAAARWPPAAFAISVSAPIVTADVQMNYLVSNRLRIEGYSKDDADQAVAARTARDQAARGLLDIKTARGRIQSYADKPWFPLIYLNPAVTEQNVALWAQNIRIDPMASLGSLNAPTLVIYGARDPVVPVAVSLQRLQSIVGQHPNVEVAVIAGADHSMMTSRSPAEQMDQSLNESRLAESPEYLGRLAVWLQRHVLIRKTPAKGNAHPVH